MRVYCDGVFDLFHGGHVDHLEQIRRLFPSPAHVLVVGVLSDDAASDYKRRPVIDQAQRRKVVAACRHVDEAFVTDDVVVSRAFLSLHRIDRVVHAFADKTDQAKQAAFFEAPIEMGIFREIEYNHGVSTTQILQRLG